MEASTGERRKPPKGQIPQRFSGVSSVAVTGDYGRHMWNVAGRNQIAVGWDTKLVLSVCCAVLIIAQSCPTLYDPINYRSGSSVHGILQVKNMGVACHALLQGIFPTQGSNPCLLSCIASGFFTCWATGTFFNLEVSDHAEPWNSHSIHSIHLLSGVWKSWWKKIVVWI